MTARDPQLSSIQEKKSIWFHCRDWKHIKNPRFYRNITPCFGKRFPFCLLKLGLLIRRMPMVHTLDPRWKMDAQLIPEVILKRTWTGKKTFLWTVKKTRGVLQILETQPSELMKFHHRLVPPQPWHPVRYTRPKASLYQSRPGEGFPVKSTPYIHCSG